MTGARVFVFDEPTVGIDVGAKREIYGLIARLAERGAGVIVISSELEEVVGLCNRVIVLREGRQVGELRGAEVTEPQSSASASWPDRLRRRLRVSPSSNAAVHPDGAPGPPSTRGGTHGRQGRNRAAVLRLRLADGLARVAGPRRRLPEDAEFTIVITGGDTIGPLQGRDAIVEFCSTTVNAQTDQRRHVITNIRLGPETDTEAEVTAILTLIVVTDGALEVKSSGLYRTRAVLDGDRWRFARMHLTLDLAFENGPVGQRPAYPAGRQPCPRRARSAAGAARRPPGGPRRGRGHRDRAPPVGLDGEHRLDPLDRPAPRPREHRSAD